MALFGKKKEEKAEDAKVVESSKVEEVTSKQPTVNLSKNTDRDLSGVLVRPHITEKAVSASESNVYTFEVRQNATKYDVRDAVKAAYGVTPVKVNIVKKALRKELSRMRGKVVKESGLKKAYVYLKAGDSINLV